MVARYEYGPKAVISQIRKSINDARTIWPPVNQVAKEDDEVSSRRQGVDLLGDRAKHLVEQDAMAVNIADRVNSDAIRRTTRRLKPVILRPETRNLVQRANSVL
jgi:hypothetical protein